uniref:G domain-containing protein n=1 Tax=Erpetoichthys calabaricus TaxID=27687 RepID=A0A8C4XE50_ERPCA
MIFFIGFRDSTSEIPTVLSVLSYFAISRTRNELLNEIRTYETLTESVAEPRILLIGQIGSGKSSFYNSVNSIFSGHVMLQAQSGYGNTSTSTMVRGKWLPFVLCDCMGMERKSNEEGIQVEDIISAIKEHVPDMYEFDPKKSLNMKHKTYKDSPRRADQMHCVVYVIEADKITLMDKSLVKKFETIRSQPIHDQQPQNMIPQLVLVTKIDEACPEVEKDLTKVYKSHYIFEKMLGFPVSTISPVKNYSKVTELDQNVDILILKALQQMLRAADACFNDMKLRDLSLSSSS